MPPAPPAFTRMKVDERRARLLEMGARIFTEHAFDEVSMAQIAREGRVSKALLYHYFPSKQEFFVATLADGVEDLARRVEPDPALAPGPALLASLGAYVDWVAERRDGYAKLVQSIAAIPEVTEVVADVRARTGARILDGLAEASGQPVPAAARTAVAGWLWFMDGAILDWIQRDAIDRDQLIGLLAGTLLGALTAAGAGDLLAGLQPG